MSNNVIQRLHTRLAQNGLVCLRFDYGGVAASEGPAIDVAASMGAFWQTGRAPIDPLLIEDAAIALEWLRERTRTTGAPALVGYSFGAHVAVRVLPSDARAIVLISPTVIHHCFDVGFSRGVPTLVISCDNDFATPAERHEQWLAQVSHDVTAHCCFAGAQHFFMEMEDELAHRITSFVNQAIALARGLG
jgi:alpha/beta superfamily hydrolase